MDPVAFVRKHHERIPYLHLKSVDPELRRQVVAEEIPFIHAVAMGMFCELSKGVVDYIALRDLLQEIEYDGWAIVEQDMYPVAFDKPLPIAIAKPGVLEIDRNRIVVDFILTTPTPVSETAKRQINR